ncbi:MAG: signal peptidase I [Clostridia bacterium]|nr:signal peptidase I [Clostridia bacterium]
MSAPAPGTRGPLTPEHVMAEILDWLKYIVGALAAGLLIVTFLIQNNRVIGESMEPTLFEGDQLLVQKVSARMDNFDYGDIVTIDGSKLLGPGEPDLVKRVVGLPGDIIDVRDGSVYRNGIPVEETYLPEGVRTLPLGRGYDQVTLGDDELFLMGDNRENSKDSRVFGAVPTDLIIGTCVIRFYPFDRIGTP